MAQLEKAIAELSEKYGGAPGGGGMDRGTFGVGMPGSTVGTFGVGMPGGTVGTQTHGIAHGPGLPGATIGTHEIAHGGGTPKSGLAGASVGTQKSLHGHFGDQTFKPHHFFGHHRPRLDPTDIKPKPPTTTQGPGIAVAHSASPGATVGTKTPAASTQFVAQAAPAPAAPAAKAQDPELARLLGSIPGGGGGADGAQLVESKISMALSNKGGGGLAGGVIGTRE